jgi:hypothetical protein
MKPIIASASFGRTSSYMVDDIIDKYAGHPIHIVYANTGEERPETLDFGTKCVARWAAKGYDTTYLEALVHPTKGVATSYRVLDDATIYRPEYCWNPDYGREYGFPNPFYNSRHADLMATRPAEWGHPFEAVIAKYGIPNNSFGHCSRELKTQVIGAWIKDNFAPGSFQMALGIRADEAEREGQWWYPLIENGITKTDIRAHWNAQPFDLELKDYEGNCGLCWKKGHNKNWTLLEEYPILGLWYLQMEQKYGMVTPDESDRRRTAAMAPLPLLDTLDIATNGLPAKRTGPFVFNHNGVSMAAMYEAVKRGKFKRVKDEEEVRSCNCGVEFENLFV